MSKVKVISMIQEEENSYGDIDYVCSCGAPVIREESICPCCLRTLGWGEFDRRNPDHIIHA